MNNLKNVSILCAFVFLVFSCVQKDAPENTGDTVGSPQPSGTDVTKTEARSVLGQAPDFAKKTLNGEEIRLSDYKGKVVLLNFWATWCAPCRREIPALIELQNKWKEKGLVIVGVALDEEGFEAVRPYAKEIGINYPVVMDDYSYGDEFGGIYMVPTTYIIDRKGNIVARKIGEVSVDDIEPRIISLLNG